MGSVSPETEMSGFTRGIDHKVMGAQRPLPESHLQAEDPKVLVDWLSPGGKFSESRKLIV